LKRSQSETLVNECITDTFDFRNLEGEEEEGEEEEEEEEEEDDDDEKSYGKEGMTRKVMRR